MSVAMKCDICGKFYEKGECSHVLRLNRRMGSGNYTNVFEGDICDHCLEKLSVILTNMGCIDSYVSKRAEACLQQEGV